MTGALGPADPHGRADPHNSTDPLGPAEPDGPANPHGPADRHGAADRHGDSGPHASAVPDDMAELLTQVVGPDGEFGHRQHVHLAFLAVRRYGTAEATVRIGRWIRHVTAYQRAPQKYNATVTRAWTEIVGEHVARDPASTDFGVFAERHPALLDKRLLTRHYSPVVLASPQARTGWAAPDRQPFPWQA